MDDFKFLYVIGKGGYGKVWKVQDRITGRFYALKQMTKAKIILEGSETSIIRERIFLAQMHSPFIVNLLLSFQNHFNLFLLMELLTGGDLRYHLINYNFFFTETQIKFLLTNIILGLEYIHSKGIVHRDLKPENVIFNTQGYLKISDFGIACYKKQLDKKDDSGTPAYMAPETILGQKQNYSVDYYSLGVLAYELIKGRVPYDSNDREEIIEMMKDGDIDLKNDPKLKISNSNFCLDFISKLLRRNPKERLGHKNGEEELKKHSFFTGINWDLIQKMKFKSPIFDVIQYSKIKHGYIQELFDHEYCNRTEGLSSDLAKAYIKITSKKDYDIYFNYFTCVCVENLVRELKGNESQIKRHYKKYRNSKKMRRSQSTNEIDYSDYQNQVLKYFINKETDKLHLPYIVNKPTEVYYKYHENKLKDYYEYKILKYKDYYEKLKQEYNNKKGQIKFMKHPSKYLKNSNFFPYFLPKIEKTKNPYDFQNYYDKMNEGRNNFFIKNKRKSFDDSSEDSSIDSDNDQFNMFNYPYNNPFFNPYTNPFWYDQNLQEKKRTKNKSLKRNKERYHTKRRSKLIKKEDKESKESNTESESEDSKESKESKGSITEED